MKKKIIGIIAIIVVAILLLFMEKGILNKNTFQTNNFKIMEGTTVNKEDFINLGPLNDSEVERVSAYKFKVTNNQKNKSKYNILIEDVVDNNKEKSILTRKYLHYELQLNNKVIKKGKLSDIKNNILDTRFISKNKTNNYALKIWLGIDTIDTDWENKYYSYNILVVPA